MNFDYVVSLLASERGRLEQERDWYQAKKPPNCCPTFTLERRKRWADKAIARIAEIDAVLEVLRQKDLASV